MAARNNSGRELDKIHDVLRDILITQLAIARVPQQTIAKLVGCNIVRVNALVKPMKLTQ